MSLPRKYQIFTLYIYILAIILSNLFIYIVIKGVWTSVAEPTFKCSSLVSPGKVGVVNCLLEMLQSMMCGCTHSMLREFQDFEATLATMPPHTV